MPQLLRTTWNADLWWPENARAWLDHGDVPADCVSDLQTKKNTLSVYEVADEAQARQVAAAIALERARGGAKDKVSLRDLAGILFDAQILDSIGVQWKKIVGGTQDKDVNDRHLDLVDLSGAKLVELAKQLLLTSEPRTFLHTELLAEIKASRASGRLRPDILPPRVKEQLDELQ